MKVAVDASYASSNDHDPTIEISDGLSFIGAYYILMEAILHAGLQMGTARTAVLTSINYVRGPTLLVSSVIPVKLRLQFKPAEQWCSCHTEHNGDNVISAMNYQRLLCRPQWLKDYILRYIEIILMKSIASST